MREILFRGFHEDSNGKSKVFINGKWIQGDWVYWDMFGRVIKDIRAKEYLYLDYILEYETIPETVGQYIGLPDINCVKIFERDILQVFDSDKNHRTQEVVYKDGGFCGYSEKKFCKYTFIEILIKAHGIKVIGNIHENPELIKE